MNPRDEERDAWLAQALRHAPDANADAPPALSDTILREARAAVRPPAAPMRPETVGLLPWLASAWGWLARPPVAAGLASVMVATLVGVMWWDQPLDETLPRAPEVVSSTPNARAETASAAVAAAPAATEVQATPAEPVAPKPGNDTRAAADQGRVAEKKEAEKKETEKSARASRPTDERTRMLGAADAAPAVAAAARPPVAFPSATPAPAPQAAATANEAPSPLAERRERTAPAAKAAAESSGQVAADTAASPRSDLRALLARIAQQPGRWRWQRGPGAPQPMNAAVQGWLAELDAQAASRWQTNTDSMARAPAGSLRLFRDGVLQATLGFSGSAVWIETPGASAPATSMAPLSESTAESLRKALDEAAP